MFMSVIGWSNVCNDVDESFIYTAVFYCCFPSRLEMVSLQIVIKYLLNVTKSILG